MELRGNSGLEAVQPDASGELHRRLTPTEPRAWSYCFGLSGSIQSLYEPSHCSSRLGKPTGMLSSGPSMQNFFGLEADLLFQLQILAVEVQCHGDQWLLWSSAGQRSS